MSLTYFSDDELKCKLTGEYILADGFGERIDELRRRFGAPLILTSAARSKKHNHNIGGNLRSLHVYDKPHHPTGGCCAIDIKMPDSYEKGKLFFKAWEMGFSIGVHRSYLHIDDRSRLLDMRQTHFTY